jgi:hypothetical protein
MDYRRLQSAGKQVVFGQKMDGEVLFLGSTVVIVIAAGGFEGPFLLIILLLRRVCSAPPGTMLGIQ